MPSEDHRAYLKELFWNQLWQSANFLSKAGFLILLTPLMILKWGAAGYGLFALASSLLVSMALLDGGVRALTRLRLAEALRTGNDADFRRAYCEGLFTFACVAAVAVVVTLGLAWPGWLGVWLNLPAGGDWVLVLTVALTSVLMLTNLGMEPLAARGNLSSLKAANTWGALVAIPLTAGAVWLGCTVLHAVLIYSICLIVPNVILAARSEIFALLSWKQFLDLGPKVIWQTLHSGVWFYLTTVSLVVKTHALTFVVSAIAGPAEAGIFYVLLRLTEIVGNVGATASETSLAALAAAKDAGERRENFRQSWIYTGVFCLYGALVMAFLGEPLLKLWLPDHGLVPVGVGWTMALFGLSGAFSRVVVNAGMGLHIVKNAALANAAEAVTDIIGAIIGYHLAGVPGLFIGGSIGLIFLIPPAWKIATLCGSGVAALYLFSLAGLAPGLLLAAVFQIGAAFTSQPVFWFGALGASGLIALWQLKKIHG